ncbi:4727_t:CDS:2, partial [Acaulospora colombiana]
MLKGINDFLREQGKDGGLRVHPTPSAKEFQDTFLFIYNITFDDDRVPGARKMDEEVIELLRVERYTGWCRYMRQSRTQRRKEQQIHLSIHLDYFVYSCATSESLSLANSAASSSLVFESLSRDDLSSSTLPSDMNYQSKHLRDSTRIDEVVE